MKYLIGLVFVFLMVGCVSQKKFNEVALERDQAEIKNEQLNKRVRLNEELIGKLQQSADELVLLKQEHQRTLSSVENLQRELSDCTERYERLLDQNRNILTSTSGEKEALLREIAQKQGLLDDKQKELSMIESALIERERKLKELTEAMDAQNARLASLKDRVTGALLGFSAADLSIKEKNGRVYVTLSQNLLFPKGSRQIDKKGVEALGKLGEVLSQNPDIHINVEGHTDTDGSADLNWDLSVTRATAVAKILIDNGVTPTRVTASGRAFYDPIAPNDTEPNKSLNRRTEIILSPRLEELFDIIRN